MRNSVGLVDIGGRVGRWERRGGGGGGRGKRGVVLIGVGDGGVGALGIERAAERWWDNIRVSSSSCAVRRVVSGQGFPPQCPSEKLPMVSRWAKVLVALVGTNEGCEWVVGQWWETITRIAPARRT